MKTELGKISAATFGFGGYQDAMIGISFTLSGSGWGVGDFWGYWADGPSPGAQWSVADQHNSLGKVTMRISMLLKAAKVDRVESLVGVPVRANFGDDGRLMAWDILREVL